jgi:phospholipase C
MNADAFRKLNFALATLLLLILSGCGTGTSTIQTPPSAPSITLSANPTALTAGQTVSLSWTAISSTSVTITATSGSSTRTLVTSSQASGSVTDSPTATTTYTAVATGTGGTSAPQNAVVQVTQVASAPQITQFTASPTTVNAGQATTLTWATTNATSITITATAGSSSRTVVSNGAASGNVTDSPTTATTYTAVATGAGGNSAPQTVTVQVAPQVTQFTANPTSITTGQATTLTWATTNATSVTITTSAGTTIVSAGAAAGSVTDSPSATTTYTAVASGPGGTSAPLTVTVQVTPPVPPQVTQFSANPTSVSAGQTTTITWATTNATAVNITPSVQQSEGGGSLPTSGYSVIPVSSTTTFTITATGPGGTATASLTVNVPLTLSFTASPTTITSGSSSTLSWQVSGGTATSLSINNSVCSSCALPSGTASVTPTATTTYVATATASDGSTVTQSATVTVSSTTTGQIKHIFFMLQENRSFDMYFGQLSAYRQSRLLNTFNITDTQTIDGFNPNVTLTNAHTGATVTPFHEANTVCTENLSPAWDESHHDVSLIGGDPQWNIQTTFSSSDFLMQGFLDTADAVTQTYDANGTRAMGYYNGTDLPYYYDLATFFATSDTWYSPLLANTVPNRMYLMAGTSFGHEYPDGDSNHPLYAAPTIFRAMNTANVSWLYYYKDGIFLANFADFYDPAIEPKTFPITDLMSRLQSGNADQELPQVIFIDSASGSSMLDEHPQNNIQSGAYYVQSIVTALMNSDAWKDSVFILSYDEGGGLYDHAAPFMVPAPDGYGPGNCEDPNNGSTNYCIVGTLGGTFNLTGMRVPLMVISPYVIPQYVSHIPRDYTAILAFIETTFNVKNLSARDLYWQDPSRSMSEFFDFTSPRSLNPPPPDNGMNWTQVLATQPTTGKCEPTLESGP